MWKPKEPIVVAGYSLSPEEAWLRCFTQKYSKLARGAIALEQLADWAIELYPSNEDRDPVEVACEEFENAS